MSQATRFLDNGPTFFPSMFPVPQDPSKSFRHTVVGTQQTSVPVTKASDPTRDVNLRWHNGPIKTQTLDTRLPCCILNRLDSRFTSSFCTPSRHRRSLSLSRSRSVCLSRVVFRIALERGTISPKYHARSPQELRSPRFTNSALRFSLSTRRRSKFFSTELDCS